MVNLLATVLAASLVISTQAACSKGANGVWNLKLFAGQSCTDSHYEYYGSLPACECYDIASPLNNNVHSFVFKSGGRVVTFYEYRGCTGAQVGVGSSDWTKTTVSSTGSSMSSFTVCH